MQKTGMKPEDIKIDPEFRDLLCTLSEYEEKALEGSLLSHGCLSPLIIEEKLGVLIDGHNRLRICKKHDIPFEVKTLMLGGREPAEKWIIRNQVGRRNLTAERMEVYIARIYKHAKKPKGFQEGNEANKSGVNQHTRTQGQNDLASSVSSNKAAKETAEKVGKSERQVRRIEKKIDAIDKAGKLAEYEQGKLPKAEVKKIVEKSKPVRKQTKAEAQEEAEVIAENQTEKDISWKDFAASIYQKASGLYYFFNEDPEYSTADKATLTKFVHVYESVSKEIEILKEQLNIKPSLESPLSPEQKEKVIRDIKQNASHYFELRSGLKGISKISR